jgi:hypothetical protein
VAHSALLGTNIITTGTTIGSVTVGSAVSVGSTVYMMAAWSNDVASVPTINSVADSRGNTYTVDVTAGAGNTTVSCALIRAPVTTALQVGDTITITISANRIRWVLQADSFDDVNTSSPLDKTSVTDTGSSTSLTTGVTATTTQAYELCVAVFGYGGGRTTSIPVGWSGTAKVETNAGSADRAVQMIYKYTSATGTQEGTLSITAGGASTYSALIGTYKATAATPGVTAPPLRRPKLRHLLTR